MKHIKWIFLVLLIISVITTGILFVDFMKSRKIKILNENTIIEQLYNEKLFRKSYTFYKNDVLVLDFNVVENPGYIIFEEKNMKYCSYEEDCDIFNYNYDNNNKTLYIESGNKFFRQGLYSIVVEDDLIELTIQEDNQKNIYSFNRNQA